jgi:Ni/Fe-hydrogenase 1 B-type cytochrome subunit
MSKEVTMRAVTTVYEKQRAWGVLLRLFHWAFALSIVTLVISGSYVHEPWVDSYIEGRASFPMAFARYVHFVAGFVLISALITRFYLWFFGNRQERILDSLPVTPRNIKNLFKTIIYYLYLTDRNDERLGHNALSMLFYVILFFLGVAQALSGLYLLFPENTTFSSMGLQFFGPQQKARLIHYLTMWAFMLFALVHIYIVIWNDIWAPEGLISSIFNGDKFKPKKV